MKYRREWISLSSTYVEGAVVFTSYNKFCPIEKIKLTLFDLNLVDGLVWRIGFDQASKYFGLCIEDTEKTIHIQLDFERNNLDSKSEFADEIFYFLKRTFEGRKVELLVLEQPIPSYEYAKRTLIELKGYLMSWIKFIPEFSQAEVGEIFPQSWKALVIPKDLGGGTCKDKSAMADVVCERIPSLLGYKRTLKHKDYDSFDAANILEGYLKYSRDENGNKMICGIIEKSHISFTAYRCIDKSEFSADEILTPFQSDDFMEQRIFSQFIPDYLVFNKRFNLHENIRMASSHNRAVVTVVPQRWLKTLMFTYDFIDIRDTSKIVLLYIYAARFFSNSEMNILKHLLPNNEKVYQ